MFVAHRLAPTHPRSQSPEAELARATKHPKRRSPAIFILLLSIRNVKTTPHRCLPLVQSHGGVCKVRGGLGPPRARPPDFVTDDCLVQRNPPTWDTFSPTPGAGETFASRLYFAPGGMSMRPQTGRWPDLGHGSDARAVRGRPPSSRKMAKMGWLRPVALWAQAGTVMESAKGLGPLLLGLFLLLLFLGERKVASLCARRVRTLIDTEVRGKAHR